MGNDEKELGIVCYQNLESWKSYY